MEHVLIEKENDIAIIRLNRPDAKNALNLQLIAELGEAADIVARDPEVKGVIVTGGEGDFAAGGDIKEMASKYGAGYAHRLRGGPLRLREAGAHPQAGGGRGQRLRPGGRHRTGPGMRHDRRFRDGRLRTARDNPGHHPRGGRHPAVCPVWLDRTRPRR